MSGEARDKELRESRLTTEMQNSVSDSLETWKQDNRKPSKSGGYNEIFNFGSPKARWRAQIFKFGPFAPGTSQTKVIAGSIPASATSHIKIEAVSIFVDSDLSSSIYVDKIGITGTGVTADTDYFYSASLSDPNFISSSGHAVLAHPGQMGTQNSATGSIHYGGWHTSSATVTVTFNAAPATNEGSMYLYVYADKIFKAFP
tara:strand:- start:65 stop:667 length:603 start_codon:yes stop_codon:yes gene_type:complete